MFQVESVILYGKLSSDGPEVLKEMRGAIKWGANLITKAFNRSRRKTIRL